MEAYKARVELRKARAAIESALAKLDGAIGEAGYEDEAVVDTEEGSVTIDENNGIHIDPKDKTLTESDNIRKSITRAWGKPPTDDACPHCGRSF